MVKVKRTMNDETMWKYKEKVGSLLSEQSRIKLLGNVKTVVIKDLDGLTDKQ